MKKIKTTTRSWKEGRQSKMLYLLEFILFFLKKGKKKKKRWGMEGEINPINTVNRKLRLWRFGYLPTPQNSVLSKRPWPPNFLLNKTPKSAAKVPGSSHHRSWMIEERRVSVKQELGEGGRNEGEVRLWSDGVGPWEVEVSQSGDTLHCCCPRSPDPREPHGLFCSPPLDPLKAS